jgi:predicted acyltransferase
MPLNKKLWSISYTFLTIGISGVSLALITIALDLVGKKNQKYQKVISIITGPFIWMGRNPLAIFASR